MKEMGYSVGNYQKGAKNDFNTTSLKEVSFKIALQ